jgi:hypothetical protein
LKQEPHESACGMGGHIGEMAGKRKARGWRPYRALSEVQRRALRSVRAREVDGYASSETNSGGYGTSPF